MSSIRMESLLFLLISILVFHKSFCQENCNSAKEAKNRILLNLTAEITSETGGIAQIPKGSNDTSGNSKKPRDCQELQQLGNSKNGVYTIFIRTKFFGEKRLNVYCDMVTDGGGWTLIQRRGQYSTPLDYFYREWYSYKDGFGNLEEEFWLGNDNIYDMTSQKRYSIRFEIESLSRIKAYAHYSSFWIDSEFYNYTLHIKNYTGTAGDAMEYHDGQRFSTKDRENDSDNTRHCARTFEGGWWYNACVNAHLNGLRSDKDERNDKTAYWLPFKDEFERRPLRDIEIKIKPI